MYQDTEAFCRYSFVKLSKKSKKVGLSYFTYIYIFEKQIRKIWKIEKMRETTNYGNIEKKALQEERP